MNRFLNLGLGVVVGTIGTIPLLNSPTQAQDPQSLGVVPKVAIPVTGGQFSVDLNIQNGQVQSYRYSNNQLPTLLTPVGTINLTDATLPKLGWYDTRASSIQYEDFQNNIYPIAGVNFDSTPRSATAKLQVTGNTQLNDGRGAVFNSVNAFLSGNATASSPFPIQSIGTATTPDAPAHFHARSTFNPLPETYQGTIQFAIQNGGITVPQSAFSSANTSETRIAISSGQFQPNYDQFISLTEAQEGLDFNFEDRKVNSGDADQITLSSSDAEISLTVKNLMMLKYPATAPLITSYDGIKRLVDIWVGIVSGNVTLANGQRLNVQDRLIRFYDNTTYDESGSLKTAVVGGELFVNSPVIIPSPENTPIAATETTSPVATTASTPDPQLSILTDTTIANQTQTTQTQPPIAPSLPNPQTVRAILDSPLSSSRIFPDMGAFR